MSPEWLRLATEQVSAALWSTDTDLQVTSSWGMALASVGLRLNEGVGQGLFEAVRTDAPEVPTVAAHLGPCQRRLADPRLTASPGASRSAGAGARS